jgi:putative addiction module antidote
MKSIKVTTVGNSVGVVLTAEMRAKLRVEKGDLLYPVETPTGIELRPYDAKFAEQMEAAEAVMRADRDILRELSKR